MTEKYTNENLWKKIGTMEANIKNIDGKITAIDSKLDIIVNLGNRLSKLEEKCENSVSRLGKLEDNQAKIVWAIILAVLGAVLGLVIKWKVGWFS